MSAVSEVKSAKDRTAFDLIMLSSFVGTAVGLRRHCRWRAKV
jgi:hypothetical protein